MPAYLVAIINRMLAKKPRDRYQTPAELLQDLEHPEQMKSAEKAIKLKPVKVKKDKSPTAVVEKGEVRTRCRSTASQSSIAA